MRRPSAPGPSGLSSDPASVGPAGDPADAGSGRRPTAERVLAILVVTGDQPWHEVVTTRLAAASPARLLVVDNGGAPAAEDLAAATNGELLRLRRPVPYGDAVALAATHPLAEDAELLWLLHDDLVVDAGALDALVAVLDARPDVAIVGPKLLDWRPEPHLQSVGMTIDAFGRAETHLQQPGELDQGQHDHRDRTLYVPSAGMLVRRDAFLALGGFDRRMTALREDLDLCWRAWLGGRAVEVVPEALGWHVAAATRSVRDRDRWRPATTRYLAERHTLAAMLKNLGLLRLAWTLPVYLLLVVARTMGFLLTRQVAVAAAAPAAVAWNAAHLPGTLGLRRSVQRARVRSDAEIADLLAHGSLRTRAYVEALVDWVRGTDTAALGRDDASRPPAHRAARSPVLRAVDVVREHPAAVVGAVLGVAWLAACAPLLGSGQIVGGQVAPWPQGASELMAAYTSGWNAGALASSAFPSPVLPVLAAAGGLVGGAAWPAQRLVVLGLLPLTWLVTLRAGRLVTAARGPRVLGATLYATSPLLLGAFGDGRLDVLVVAAALPMALLQAGRIAQPGVAPGRAWRAVAGLALVIALAIAAAPMAWPVLVVPAVAVAVVAAVNRRARRTLVWRLLAVGLGVVGVLLPWLLALDDGVVEPTYPPVALSLLDALSGQIGLLDGLPVLAATLWTAAVATVVLGAVVVGMRTRGPAVLLLLAGLIASSGAAVLAARAADPAGLWAPFVLLPATLSVAGLGVVAARSVLDVLRRHEMGVRHALALVAALAVAVGPAATVATVVRQPAWDELRRAPALVPLFVDADADRVGPYRVLLLQGDATRLAWDVVEAGGRVMTAVPARADARLTDAVDDVVTGLVAGRRDAAGAAGLLNVRYIVTRDDTTRALFADAVGDLEAVEPLAGGGGRVYEVRTWLPRVAALDADVVRAAADGRPLDADRVEAAAVPRTGVGRYAGGPVDGEVLWIAEPDPAAWVADASGRPVDEPIPDLPVPVTAFALDGESEGIQVAVDPTARRLWIAWQVAVVLLLLSLALRAPGQPVPRRRPEDTGPLHTPPEAGVPDAAPVPARERVGPEGVR